MSRKKDKALVIVIADLTDTQATDILGDVMKSKSKHAPNARASAGKGMMDHLGKLLASKQKQIGGE